VARNSRSVRLVLALSVAGVLAVFLLYVSIAGGRTPQLSPSQLSGHKGQVSLVGRVVGPVHGAGYSGNGLRFGVTDIGGASSAAIPVVYHGSVPDLFKVGRHIVVDGRYRNGVFVAKHDTLVTKCPSKYTPRQKT
jgi:cytochrome c-type biogenesis protein CcmE